MVANGEQLDKALKPENQKLTQKTCFSVRLKIWLLKKEKNQNPQCISEPKRRKTRSKKVPHCKVNFACLQI